MTAQKPTYEELEQRIKYLENPELDRKKALDVVALNLAEVVDTGAIQSLMDDFFSLTNIGVGIIDLNGKVLVATGWQDICTKFHRVHPESTKNCLKSDLELSNGVEPGTFRLYRCENNMWDIATPITVGDKHIGNLYLGQFLFEDETPDLEVFRSQAQKFGFNEEEYLAALERVPRWSKETVNTVMTFYTNLAHMISELGYSNIKIAQTLKEQDNLINLLQKSEERYRSLVEIQTDLVCRFIPDGTLVYVNDAYSRFFEKTKDELIGKKWQPLLVSDDTTFVQKLQTLSPLNPTVLIENKLFSGKGDVQWMQFLNIGLFDHDGSLLEIQSVGRNITDRKRAEEELQESTKKIKLFAYSVSHDLKSPAISIHGLTKRLSKLYRNVLDENGKTCCDQIVKASEQIAGLAQNINVYISTKEAPVTIENVDLGELFHMVREEIRPRLSIRKIRWSQPATLPEIKADRLAVVRVIRNLVDNALKYGGDDLSEINIGYQESDESHILSVMDDGIGLEPGDSKDIFDVFKRMKTSRGIEGAGLGLAIVKEIAERHAGKVWIEQGTEKGIEFSVSISKYLQLSQ